MMQLTHAGLVARNRDTIVNHMIHTGMERLGGPRTGGFARPVLEFTMPCGYHFTARTIEDIPMESLICPCGQHYIIYYQERYDWVHQN